MAVFIRETEIYMWIKCSTMTLAFPAEGKVPAKPGIEAELKWPPFYF